MRVTRLARTKRWRGGGKYRVIYITDAKPWYGVWGWQTGCFGYRAFCVGWLAVGR